MSQETPKTLFEHLVADLSAKQTSEATRQIHIVMPNFTGYVMPHRLFQVDGVDYMAWWSNGTPRVMKIL